MDGATPQTITGPRLLSINNYHYRRGGAEVVFLEHNRLFAGMGWQVLPFAMRHPRNLPAVTENYFADEIEFGEAYGLRDKTVRAARIIYSREARGKLERLIADTRPAVAHAHNIYHHISPAIFPLLKREGIPTVMTVHDLKLACPAYTMRVGNSICERCRGGRIHNVVRHRCIKGSLALSTLVFVESAVHRLLGLYADNISSFVVPSRFVIDKLVEWGWPRERFVHIPNFVDPAAHVPATEPGEGFVYFGRLSPEKGLTILIEAAQIARVPVTIIGSGPQEAELRALVEHLGADVRFLGHRSGQELHDAVRAARAVVLPAIWYENAPMTILEAYALGRAVIGSRIGGIPELIRDGETGSIVPPGDVHALAAELGRFASMPAVEIMAMGAEGRAWIESSFTAEGYCERMSELYASLGWRRA